jgi:hypothetical protein
MNDGGKQYEMLIRWTNAMPGLASVLHRLPALWGSVCLGMCHDVVRLFAPFTRWSTVLNSSSSWARKDVLSFRASLLFVRNLLLLSPTCSTSKHQIVDALFGVEVFNLSASARRNPQHVTGRCQSQVSRTNQSASAAFKNPRRGSSLSEARHPDWQLKLESFAVPYELEKRTCG